MSIWSVDADDIKKAEDFDEGLLYKTGWIDGFLKGEREDKFFVIATKGFGKTLLLKAKRICYEQKGRNIPCLPEDSLLDKPLGDKIFSSDMLELYNSVQSWSNLWLVSITITILKYTKTLNVSNLNPNPNESEKIYVK